MRRLLAALFFVLALGGVIVRLTVRDGYAATATLFYATPWLVLAALFALAALLGRGRMRRLSGLAALVVAGGGFALSYGFARPEAGTWKIITWNMEGPKHPSRALLDLVRLEQPDLLALIEAGTLNPEVARAYERALPGYHFVILNEDRALLSRSPVTAVSVQSLGHRSRLLSSRVTLGDHWLRVLLVDLDSSPLLPRRDALTLIGAAAARDRSTVVLGDFNTPADSVWLEPLRDHFDNVMEGPHAGFRETWFHNVPLLSLDQIWVSRDLQPVFARRAVTTSSDHSPVIALVSPR